MSAAPAPSRIRARAAPSAQKPPPIKISLTKILQITFHLLCISNVTTLPRPMKAERRRELKVNSLVWHLQGLPTTIKKYQSQILLALTLIALAVILIENRVRASREKLQAAQQSL